MLTPSTKAWNWSRWISTSPSSLCSPASAHDRFHPRDQLLGMAGLGQPVVSSEPQAPYALGDGRAARADDDAELRQCSAQALEPLPAGRPDHRQVDDYRTQAHRNDRFRGDR
jgi:hypothetical protein